VALCNELRAQKESEIDELQAHLSRLQEVSEYVRDTTSASEVMRTIPFVCSFVSLQ